MRGRKRKPAAIKLLQGIPGRQASEAELKAELLAIPRDIPEAPEWLSSDAKAEFDRLVSELAPLGVLTRKDRLAIARLADVEAVAQWIGRVITQLQSASDTSILREEVQDLVKLKLKAIESVRKFLSEFGLTPVSESRLNVRPKQDVDPMEEFIGRAS